MQITISPPIVGRSQQIQLEIQGLPISSVPAESPKIIGNSLTTPSELGITVKDKNVWKKTFHDEQVSVNGRIGFGSTPFYITIPNDIEIGSHMLNITVIRTVLGSTIKKNYNISFIINQPAMPTNLAAISINPERFLCSKDQLAIVAAYSPYDTISECCGPNYLYCINRDKNVSRISGGPTGLLKDYYGNDAQNNVYRFAFQENYLSDNTHKKPISDLS